SCRGTASQRGGGTCDLSARSPRPSGAAGRTHAVHRHRAHHHAHGTAQGRPSTQGRPSAPGRPSAEGRSSARGNPLRRQEPGLRGVERPRRSRRQVPDAGTPPAGTDRAVHSGPLPLGATPTRGDSPSGRLPPRATPTWGDSPRYPSVKVFSGPTTPPPL